jgi:outer membrane murein-binding lipoprotein Lpp
MNRSVVQSLACAASFLLGMGCASQSDAGSRQVRELSEQVRRIQSATDRLEERLAAVENARQRDAQRPAGPVSLTTDVPELPVVKVQPAPAVSTNDLRPTTGDGDEPRPLIVGEGSRIETRPGGGESLHSNLPVRRSKDKTTVETTSTKRQTSGTDSGKKTP